jgi:hypothetical protein
MNTDPYDSPPGPQLRQVQTSLLDFWFRVENKGP